MDGESLAGQLILQLVLIICNAVFACAEIAVISINDNKVAKLAAEGDKRAVRLARLKNKPAQFLATIQVAITLSGFMGSAFAADNFAKRMTDKFISMGMDAPADVISTISVVFTTLILSYFTLVFGELVPKRLAMKKAESLALVMSSMITVLSKLFAPVVWLLTKSTNAILRLMRIDPEAEEAEVSEEEIILMVDAGSEKGTIAKDAQEIIENVFRFDDIAVGDIITHRKDVKVLWMDENDEEWRCTIDDNTHSLFPVCAKSKDDIVGILSAKKYYRLRDKSRENILRYAVRGAYYVPETVKADVLFRNMKKTKNRLAVVLDEYGGMRGIVTINDLVEELVGDFNEDTFDDQCIMA
ncbi:MAG: HlyC/CorC family transporter [Clostridiales bacterium]|nr:HlyC/CorC family transporter [Clostridiales bacterium]